GGTGGFLAETKDRGQTWQVRQTGTAFTITFISFLNEYRGMYTSARGTVAVTDNGGTDWTYNQIDYYPNYICGGWLDQDRIFVAGDQYVGSTPPFMVESSDGGVTWEKVPLDHDNSIQAVFFVDGQLGWLVGDNGMILHASFGTP
ncbi:MAG: YCF48-related protein, partial [Candidatus Zixiibacteriota bacterium]